MKGPITNPSRGEWLSDAPEVANTPASVTITAESDDEIVIEEIAASYSAQPTAGIALTIVAASTSKYKHYVGRELALAFRYGIPCGRGNSVTVTLPPGGTGSKGSLGVRYR
jgi:hypothetical protein